MSGAPLYLIFRATAVWELTGIPHSFTVGAIVIACSYSVPQIIVGRLIKGLGVGGAAVIAPLYVRAIFSRYILCSSH